MKKLLQYYQLFCNLSLDIVFGVLINALVLQQVFSIHAPINWFIGLTLGTWLIYLIDHLVDVKRAKTEFPTYRHQFIKQYYRQIIVLSCFISAALAYRTVSVWDKNLVFCGLLMGAFILIHLLLTRINPQHKSLANNKELGVALIYAGSIYCYPLYLLWGTDQWSLLCNFGIALTAITYQNLVLCSIIEFDIDEQMDNNSIVRVIGLQNAKRLLITLSIVVAMFLVYLAWAIPSEGLFLPISYGLIVLGNASLYRYYPLLKAHFLYRKIAEALFWLPLIGLV